MSLFSRYADKWNEYTDHWKDQYREHKEEWELAGVAVGTLLAGPGVAGAYAAVQAGNVAGEKADAYRAAAKSFSSDPIRTQQDVQSATGVPGIGATGEITLPSNLTAWLPLLLLFVIVMYAMFKD